MKKKVALFGAGKLARERYFLLDDLFEIECCYDNDKNKWGEYIIYQLENGKQHSIYSLLLQLMPGKTFHYNWK